MIFDHIGNYENYKGIDEKVDKVMAFIQNTSFENLTTGTHEVEGEEFYFNLLEYQTNHADERFWESHKKYLDIHYLIEGKEFIGHELFKRMEIKDDYNVQDDFFLLKGKLQSKIKLQKGDFLICYPNDVHMTGIMVDGQEKVRKAVFKVKI